MVTSRIRRYSFTLAHKNEFKMTIHFQDIQFPEDFVLWSPKFEPDRPVRTSTESIVRVLLFIHGSISPQLW